MINRMMARAVIGATVVCALAMPAAAQWSGSYGAVKTGKPVAYAGTLPDGLWKRSRKADATGTTKVVIPFFQIQFRTASKASSNRSFASLSQSYVLDGVGQADMQAMADTLYDRFVADLAAQGLTVIPLDEARAKSPALA